jgi:hypothetical protein
VVIDGATQPGFDGGKPVVHVDGSHLAAAAPATNGFQIEAGVTATIQALQILRFTQNGIENYGNLTLAHMEIAVNQIDGVDSYIASGLLTVTISDSTIFENAGSGVAGINTNFHLNAIDMSRNTGGGLRVIGGTLILDHGSVNDNATINDGGGISLSMVANPVISNSAIKGNTSGHKGGGLYLWNLPASILTVENCTFDGNYGYDGGGIYIDAGSSHLSASTLINNIAKHHGGGIFVNINNNPTLWIENGTVIGRVGAGNIASFAPASHGLGGGIYNKENLNIAYSTIEANVGDGIYNDGGTITMQDSTVKGNSGSGIESYAAGIIVDIQIFRSNFFSNAFSGIDATNANLPIAAGTIGDNKGSGIRMHGGKLTMANSTVLRNRSAGDGGGIAGYNLEGEIRNSTVSDNIAAASGGGLYLEAWMTGIGVNLVNVTISGNTAGTLGGGLHAVMGPIRLNNVTIARNAAPASGGLQNAAAVALTNSILAENTGGNCLGMPTSLGNNLDDGISCAFSGPNDISGMPANLGPLANNGGGSFTNALLPGSAALEAGNDTACPATDQRGIARPQGLHCDMGAFEAETPATATPPAATNTLTPTLIPTTTPTSTPAPISFDPVNFSTDVIYSRYGRSCSPQELTVQVKVSPPEMVYSLGLFYRLVEKDGANVTPWSAGFSMIPQGGGWYTLTVYGEDFPDATKWGHDALLEIQLVANGKDGQPIARSEVYRKVTLARCKQ